jgi:hypothetical protein
MSSILRRAAVVSFVGVAMALALASPVTAAGGRPFSTTLTGAAEVNAQGVPNQGDPDGSGTATLRINPGLGEVCWSISVSGVDPIFAAHIHIAPVTSPGPIVVPLSPYTGGCTVVDRDLARAILIDPSGYYVNVHNATYPAGALRGQLNH